MNIEFGPGELFWTDCAGEFYKLADVTDMVVEQANECSKKECAISLNNELIFNMDVPFSSIVKILFGLSKNKNIRVAHLACYGKKYRVRKKNLHRVYK